MKMLQFIELELEIFHDVGFSEMKVPVGACRIRVQMVSLSIGLEILKREFLMIKLQCLGW